MMKGGFAPGLEAALDAYMKNGELLKDFSLNALPNAPRKGNAFVSIVATKGSETFSKTYGVNSETKEPLSADGDYPSAFFSQTKLVANMCAMKFWEDNVIDLDEPCWKYLPEAHTDSDITNPDSVYPLHVIRKILPTHNVVDGKVTVDGVTYDVLTHQVGDYWVGGRTETSPFVMYFLEPVALNDYPSMRNFMTHCDGFLGYEGFFASVPQAAATLGYGHYFVALEQFMALVKSELNLASRHPKQLKLWCFFLSLQYFHQI